MPSSRTPRGNRLHPSSQAVEGVDASHSTWRTSGPGQSDSRPKEDGATSAVRDYGADEGFPRSLVTNSPRDWSRYLFPSRLHARPHLSTRQYSPQVHRWVDSVDLKSISYGTHSMAGTKVTQIYRKTGNLRAVQLLLGHTKPESTVRYLGIEVGDALHIASKSSSSHHLSPAVACATKTGRSLKIRCWTQSDCRPHFNPTGCFSLASSPQSARI
ncbi:tyrosine-type recombinase/integrase [Bradyrhizobium sp. URHC0002]